MLISGPLYQLSHFQHDCSTLQPTALRRASSAITLAKPGWAVGGKNTSGTVSWTERQGYKWVEVIASPRLLLATLIRLLLQPFLVSGDVEHIYVQPRHPLLYIEQGSIFRCLTFLPNPICHSASGRRASVLMWQSFGVFTSCLCLSRLCAAVYPIEIYPIGTGNADRHSSRFSGARKC